MSSAQQPQVNLSEYYALQAFQRANGNSLETAGAARIISATATIDDGLQSARSARSPSAAGAGIVHAVLISVRSS